MRLTAGGVDAPIRDHGSDPELAAGLTSDLQVVDLFVKAPASFGILWKVTPQL